MKATAIEIPFKVSPPVLAVGSQTKNTVCFAGGNTALLSPVHSDLGSPEDFFNFEKDAASFLKKKPKIIACDLHPEYSSTKFAQTLRATSYELRAIQHHHSHIASCMAENRLDNQKVIGIAFDGTGLGADNTLWGAEFLVCDYRSFTRAAHLKEIPLVGGEKAVLEPWRLVEAWFGFPKSPLLKKVYASGINSPLASSMGRLFDAAGCLILGKAKVSSEAELPIELERLAASCELSLDCARGKPATGYNFSFSRSNSRYILDPLPMLKEIRKDIKKRIPKEEMALRFHLAVAEMADKTACLIRNKTRIKRACLSGGVFQNKLLLNLVSGLLYKEGFKVFSHKKLSCNDSSISLGQAVIAGIRS